MKKLHSLFILLILTSAVFVGCSPSSGDNSDGGSTGNGGGTTTVDADETTFGFTKTVNYTVVANGKQMSKTGAELIALAKEKNLVKDTDYTINGTTVTLTASGAEKYLGKTTEKYSLSVNVSNDGYIITGGKFEAGKTVTLPIILRDGTGNTAPTEPYLVKVHIKDIESKDLDIPVTVTKDHKIQFTMPEKNITVFAKFCDIRYERQKSKDLFEYEAVVKNFSDSEVKAVLCFNCKAYDNLKEVPLDGEKYYVLELGNLEHYVMNETKYTMYFTETKYGDYELIKTGTLDDKHYKFGVIDANGKLTILETSDFMFIYQPNAGLQSK